MAKHNEENDLWFLSKIADGTISVSEDGEVFNNKTGRYIGAQQGAGYLKISMAKRVDGKLVIVHMQIHRLVWLHFKGPIPQGLEVNHKDLNKSNPRLSNLDLQTPKGNAEHATLNGVDRRSKTGGHKNANAKFTREQVEMLRRQFKSKETTVKEIMINYSVSKPVVYWMLEGRTYK
jgi:hypothetical protein